MIHSSDRLPESDQVLMEGMPVDRGTWRTISFEVQQSMEKRMPRWRKLLINAGTFAAFLAALGAATQINLPTWAGVPSAIVILLIWILLTQRLQASTLRSVRWHVMARHGLPICTGCGYNLTAIESRVCPECGRAIGANPVARS